MIEQSILRVVFIFSFSFLFSHFYFFFTSLFDRNGQRIDNHQATKPRKAIGSGQKEQGSLRSRQERTVPSKKTDSKESQARKRSDLVPVISNPAVVQRRENSVSPCSSKDVCILD